MKDDWQARPLGEVCTVVNGGTPKTGVSAYWDGPHQWITPAEMGRRASPLAGSTVRTLTDQGLAESSATLVPTGSVILSTRAPIGHLVINEVPMAFNQGRRGLVPGPGLSPRFLFHHLDHSRELLDSMGTGATFKELSASRLKEVRIPVPPLAEQERIVRILDEALDGIATARASIEASIEATDELIDVELDTAVAQAGRDWPSAPLESLCKHVTVGHVGPMKQEYRPAGVPFLRSQNVRPFELALDNVNFVSAEFHRQLSKSALAPGDVAIVRTGYPGTAAVVPESLPVANCADLVIARPGPALLPQYLAAFLNSHTGRRVVGAEIVGAAQQHFNVTSAKQALVPVPPTARQQEIVDRVTAVRRDAAVLRSRLTSKTGQLERLRRSLLAGAFAGEL